MSNIRSSFIAVAMLVSCSVVSFAESLPPLELVPVLDPQKYVGRWYEIARYQHSFEKNVVGATADYTLREDGKIDVYNSGFKKTLDGKASGVNAVAWIPDPAKPGALKVKFFGLFSSDYLVFGLDSENYEWALVGNDSRKFLWFLARTPAISGELFERMKKIAEGQGYDLAPLYEVPQKAR